MESKIIYYANKQTGFYTQEVELPIPDNFVLPDYATFTKPNDPISGKLNQLQSDGNWSLVDDPDCVTAYSITTKEKIVVKKDEIPNTFTELKPIKSTDIFYNNRWDSEENFINELKTTIINKINFKTRTKIESGYESSILGKTYIYDSSLTDQFEIDFLSRQDSDFEIKCTGPDGIKKRILHTKEQIKSLATEFLVYVSGLKVVADSEKTGILESDYTIEELENILKQ